MFDADSAPRLLSQEQEEIVHEQAMRILEEIGTDVLHDGARKLLADAGCAVKDERVRWDRAFVMEQVAKAPRTFTLHARNSASSVEVGGGTPLWMNVGGPPFASDLDEGRRSGRMQDHDTIVKLTHAAEPLNCVQVGAAEATDLSVVDRHMDMEYSAIRWSDLPYTTYGTSGPRARDGVAMARIVHGVGGDGDADERTLLLGIVNPNSPLIWDFRMTDALLVWAEANQGVVVTPFLLAGATSPVSVAGGLAQQVAEALSGVALAQLVRSGVPCLYGSFFTVTDMRTGAPAFGTPESVFGVIAGAQMARRYGLPFRGGGGLASSNAVDAQAAAETQMMLWATMLAGTDVVLHAAGWLEGGLTASFEKLALDVELLRQFKRQREGIGFTEEELAFDALAEAGPGGLFLASQHTMSHFKEWLYMSPLFQTTDFATWETMGSETLEVTANRAWKQLLESYEDPGLDPAIDEELQAYISSRRGAPDLKSDD